MPPQVIKRLDDVEDFQFCLFGPCELDLPHLGRSIGAGLSLPDSYGDGNRCSYGEDVVSLPSCKTVAFEINNPQLIKHFAHLSAHTCEARSA